MLLSLASGGVGPETGLSLPVATVAGRQCSAMASSSPMKLLISIPIEILEPEESSRNWKQAGRQKSQAWLPMCTSVLLHACILLSNRNRKDNLHK